MVSIFPTPAHWGGNRASPYLRRRAAPQRGGELGLGDHAVTVRVQQRKELVRVRGRAGRRLGFGRIIAPEREAPNISVNMV